MDKLTQLGMLLTAANAIAPLIAGLKSALKSDNPELSESQIEELAMARALETRAITEVDMQR